MKSPLPLILVLFLATAASATCEIDGEWTKNSYGPTESMKFEGDIDPPSGFVRGRVENPLGDTIAEIPLKQIDDEFEVSIDVNESWLNGTYTARFYYDSYSNGTPCEDSIYAETLLKTNNSDEDIELDVILRIESNASKTEVEGSPVETPLGRITSKVVAQAVSGLPPSIKIEGTQLVPGTSLGTVDLHFTVCQTNENILSSYQEMANFLKSNYSDVSYYIAENSRLNKTVEDQEDTILGLVGNLSTWKARSQNWEGVANSKVDYPVAMLIFLPLGMMLMVLIQVLARRMSDKGGPPPALEDSHGIIVHD